MKKIYLMLMLLTVGVAANAQRNLTLKCEIVNPTYNQNIITGSTVNFQYKIINNSATTADSLQKGDTIKIFDPASKFDGTSLTTYSGNVVLSSSITKGGTLTITTSTPLPFASILTLADPADGLKYKSAPFTANKQYAWFFSIYQIAIPAGNIAIASTSTAAPDTGLVWINKTSGINETATESNDFITTYPNPAVNQVSFDYNFKTTENAVVRILDVTGRTILGRNYEKMSGTQKFDLDINNLNNGSYFLHFIVGDKTMINKFNVQK